MLLSKRVYLQNLSNKDEFDLHGNEPLGETYLYMNAFAQKLNLIEPKGNLETASAYSWTFIEVEYEP